MDVYIETLEPNHVARIRHVGRYTEVGFSFERLFKWEPVIGVPTSRVLTPWYDDPASVSPAPLR